MCRDILKIENKFTTPILKKENNLFSLNLGIQTISIFCFQGESITNKFLSLLFLVLFMFYFLTDNILLPWCSTPVILP